MHANLREIAEAATVDPKQALLDAVGELSYYEVFHNLVLIATYVASEKVGSLYMPDQTLTAGRFYNEVGLVLKSGPLAFRDDDAVKFGGITIATGDWVLYKPSEAWEHFIRDRRGAHKGVSVRLVHDTRVLARVVDPTMIGRSR
jgi:hypothetical protein